MSLQKYKSNNALVTKKNKEVKRKMKKLVIIGLLALMGIASVFANEYPDYNRIVDPIILGIKGEVTEAVSTNRVIYIPSRIGKLYTLNVLPYTGITAETIISSGSVGISVNFHTKVNYPSGKQAIKRTFNLANNGSIPIPPTADYVTIELRNFTETNITVNVTCNIVIGNEIAARGNTIEVGRTVNDLSIGSHSSFTIQNISGGDVWVGPDNTVTLSNGIKIIDGDHVEADGTFSLFGWKSTSGNVYRLETY